MSLGLSLTVGFFKTSSFFSNYQWAFSGSQEGQQHPNVFVGLRRLNIITEICWLSALNLKDILVTTTLAKSWTGFMLNMFCPMMSFCPFAEPLPPLSKQWAYWLPAWGNDTPWLRVPATRIFKELPCFGVKFSNIHPTSEFGFLSGIF